MHFLITFSTYFRHKTLSKQHKEYVLFTKLHINQIYIHTHTFSKMQPSSLLSSFFVCVCVWMCIISKSITNRKLLVNFNALYVQNKYTSSWNLSFLFCATLTQHPYDAHITCKQIFKFFETYTQHFIEFYNNNNT